MPEGNDGITAVIFRKWRPSHGEGVMALFPEDASSADGYFCNAYEHVGGHGGADYRTCIRTTRPASPAEYADLKAELEGIGYKLRVVKRVGYKVHQKRRDAARSTT